MAVKAGELYYDITADNAAAKKALNETANVAENSTSKTGGLFDKVGQRMTKSFNDSSNSANTNTSKIGGFFKSAGEIIARTVNYKPGDTLSTWSNNTGQKLLEMRSKFDRGSSNGFGLGIAVGAGMQAFNVLSGGIGSLISQTVSASDSMDKFKSTMKFAGIDDKAIKQAGKSAKKYADDTVYDLDTITNTTAQLAANGIKNYTELTQAAGNVNAVAGGNADTFKSVAMVMTQTAGAGKLTTENWNQLADAIPGASGKLQEAMKNNGSYTGNFRDAMEKGEISADEFNKALVDLGNTDVAKKAATSTATFEGAIGNLQASIVTKLNNIVDQVGKKKMTEMINSISNGVGKIIEFIGKAISFVSANKDWLVPLAAGIATFITGIKVAMGVISIMTGVMGMSFATLAPFILPVIAVIAGIAAAVAIVIVAVKNWGKIVDWLKGIWDGIVGFFSGLWTGIVNIFKSAINGIGSFLSSGFGQAIMFIINPFAGLINFFVQNWSSIKQIFTSAISGISSFVSSAWNVMATIIKTTMNIIWSVIQVAWQLIKVIFEFVVGGIVAFLKMEWQGIQNIIEVVMNAIKAVIETVWNAISPFIMMVLNAIKGTFESVWNGIQTVISTVLNVINTVITSVWNFIAPFIMGVLNGIANTFSMVWNGIQMVISTVMNVISSIISSVWNGISGVISGVVNGISSFVSGAWNAISSITSSVFNAVSGVISGIWNGISSFISGVVNGVSNTVSSVWSGLGGIASGAFNGVMSAASNVLNGVSSFVSGIVNKIKGFFNFHLSFPKIDIPHIPMPHFKISGDFNPLKGKIPSVGVDWYAKGGIMTGPTIFGMNGNNLQVGGEAGREAVLPLTKDVLGKIGAGAIQAAPQSAMAGNFTVNQYMTEQPNITPREQQRLARTEFTKVAREYKRGN